MLKNLIKLIGIVVIVKLLFLAASSIPSKIDNNENVTCKQFNVIGEASNSDEFTKTKFTKEQYEIFLPIAANYFGEIAAGIHGNEYIEAMLIMNNAGSKNFVLSNSLSISRHDCLLDDKDNLKQLVINSINLFLDAFNEKAQEASEFFKKMSDSLPINVDHASDLVRVTYVGDATVEYDYIMKNVSSHDADKEGIPSFIEGMRGLIKEDVCQGNSLQSDLKGFSVIYNYHFNDDVLISSFNLRNIKLINCPWKET